MREYAYENLNIARLLELGDLDIRSIAAHNPNIHANDYFKKVEDFILNIQITRDELVALSTEEEERTLEVLNKIKNTLEDIGYSKLNIKLASAANAKKTGDAGGFLSHISDISASLGTLYERIKTTYSIKRFSTPAVEQQTTFLRPAFLSEALNYFDYLEENRKLRILAVDDVSVVLNTIISVLNPYYEVFALKNSSQVEKFLSKVTPELFLLDIEMDEVNGFDLIPLIRNHEDHKNTPIMFLTGNASINNIKDAIALGACDFITKPVDKDILLEKIGRNIVRKKSY